MKRAAPHLALAFVMASCGGPGTSDTTSPAAPAVDTTAPATTDPAAGKLAPVTINVTVGTDSGAGRRENVALGAPVTVELVNPGSDDEFHLHGYDLSTGETPRGVTSSISFTADKAGEFELESHVAGDVLVVLVVS
jgi:hypothetical protein